MKKKLLLIICLCLSMTLSVMSVSEVKAATVIDGVLTMETPVWCYTSDNTNEHYIKFIAPETKRYQFRGYRVYSNNGEEYTISSEEGLSIYDSNMNLLRNSKSGSGFVGGSLEKNQTYYLKVQGWYEDNIGCYIKAEEHINHRGEQLTGGCIVCGERGINIQNAKVCIEQPIVYDGTKKEPVISLLGINGEKLIEGVDYEYDYWVDTADYDNVNASTPTKKAGIRVYGLFEQTDYYGEATLTFDIQPEIINKVSLDYTSFNYTGSVKKPKVTNVYDTRGKKISSDNYTVTYSSNSKNPGTYKVTVTGINNLSGSITRTYSIKIKGTSLIKLTSGKGSVGVYWYRQTTGTTGYQIQYSYSSTFNSKYTSTKTMSPGTSVGTVIGGYKYTLKNLYRGTKYYVRVRTYKTISSKKYYSSWSSKKSITTKY